jgi:hypothetical protein
VAKLVVNNQLRDYVQERLLGVVRGPNDTVVPGAAVPAWKGRNKPHRQDHRWANAWSPEQISRCLLVDLSHDGIMRISHKALYQALYIQGRGALQRGLVACLRRGRARACHRRAVVSDPERFKNLFRSDSVQKS